MSTPLIIDGIVAHVSGVAIHFRVEPQVVLDAVQKRINSADVAIFEDFPGL